MNKISNSKNMLDIFPASFLERDDIANLLSEFNSKDLDLNTIEDKYIDNYIATISLIIQTFIYFEEFTETALEKIICLCSSYCTDIRISQKSKMILINTLQSLNIIKNNISYVDKLRHIEIYSNNSGTQFSTTRKILNHYNKVVEQELMNRKYKKQSYDLF